jgi:putative ABC transport system permease protein
MLRDLRFAIHLLIKERWYSTVAIVALALGIGVNATVFTLVNAILIRGLPYQDSAHLYMLGSQWQNGNRSGVSLLDFQDWRTQAKTFAGLAGFSGNGVNVSDDRSAPQSARSAGITANVFPLLAVRPIVGRNFTADDEKTGAESVAILGYDMWKSRYAEDRGILGKSLRLDGKPVTIIGVMPQGEQFPQNTEIWTPIVPTADQQKRESRFLQVFGRLRPDASRTLAQTELNGIASRLAGAYPDTNKNITGVRVETFNERFNGGNIRTVMLAMMGAVGFVLLIACANVANLQLSRSVHRSREVAVRIALGATRWRVVRQLLVESVLLGALGGVIGLGLAAIGVRLFDNAVAGSGKPYWVVFTMDYTVFGFLAAICVVTGVLFGLVPALQVTKTNVNEVLKEGGRGNAGGRRARWLTGTMVVLELALTLVLLVGAGLMIRSFLKLYTIDIGIRTDHLVTMRIQLPSSKYPPPPAPGTPGASAQAAAVSGRPGTDPRLGFYDRLLPRLEAVAGVEAVAFTNSVPPFGGGSRGIDIEGRPARKPEEKAPTVGIVTISPRFFDTVGVKLQRGRSFHETDGTPGNETVIINQKLAAQFFASEDPIGRRIRFAPNTPVAGQPQQPQPSQNALVWRTIVGISPTIRHSSPQDAEPPPVMYVPHRQNPPSGGSILVRSRLDVGAVMNAVRTEVGVVDPDQPILAAQTMDQMLEQQMWPYRVFGSLFAIFAVIALVMSAVGLYAVMAYSVTQRTTEIGVRMALGAEGRQVSWLILKRGLWQMGLGLTLGLAGAFGLSRVLRTLLVQVTPTDPVTFAAITTILTTVAIAACVIPARRATRVDPLIALRAE